MRLFLGLELPDAQRDALVSLQGKIGQGRLVDPDDLHMTLVFLDEVDVDAAEDLDRALDGLDLRLGPVALAGLDVFGGDAPRALWVGVQDGHGLAALASRLAGKARGTGLAPPRRRFVPHVTLARFARGQADIPRLQALLARDAGIRLMPFQPTSVALFRSHAGRTPPLYEVLARYALRP